MKQVFALILLAPVLGLVAQGPVQPKPTAPPAASFTPAVAPDKVIITAGDLKLTAAQFNQVIELLPEQNRANARGEGRRQFAQELVRVLVLAQEGKRLKIDETPSFKAQVEFQAQNLLAGKAFAEVAKVSDAEVRQYFEEHKAEFASAHAHHILVRAAGSPVPLDPGQKDRTVEDAMARALELRAKLAAGADFAELATRESDDSGTRGQGGDMGTFHRGQVMPQLEGEAFTLKIGELSEPIKTPLGYHILRVDERSEPNFEKAKGEIEQRLQPKKSESVVDSLLKKASVTLDPDFFGPPAK
jgi:parvulin-like peptidyl-prolyl isomerase